MAFVVLQRQGAAAAKVGVNVDHIIAVDPHEAGSVVITTAAIEEPNHRLLVVETVDEVLGAVSRLKSRTSE